MDTVDQIVYSYNIPPETSVRMAETTPFPGYATLVMMHFPSGCNALVAVRVGHEHKQFCPRDGAIALDGATTSFRSSKWFDADEEIWVEMENGDTVNSHAITVTVQLEESAQNA